MKVLLSWMREFAAIRGTSEQIAETLSDLGMAVEEIVPIGEGLDGIVDSRMKAIRIMI